MEKKRGQVWVETVIYTLIGLAIMGLILAMAKPKIDQKKDEIVIEQSIEAMRNIDGKIDEIKNIAGNRRSIELKITKGSFVIDMDDNALLWIIESSYAYSEPGVSVPLGDLNVTTSESSPWEVVLETDYSVEVRYSEQSTGTKEFGSASAPYKLIFESSKDSDGNIVIDIWEA